MTRILIADTSEVVRSGIRRILEAHPDLRIIAECADGKEAILEALDSRPDVAVIELCLAGVSGIEVTRQVRQRLPGTEVLIFALYEDEASVRETLCAGARGYVLKSDPGRCLLEAVGSLAAHRPYFTDRVAELLLRSLRARKVGKEPSHLRGAARRDRQNAETDTQA